MGSTYTNVTLVGVTLDAVREVAPRPAFALMADDSVVLYAAADEEGVTSSAEAAAAALGCVAVTASVFDDDVLYLRVHDRGVAVFEHAVPDPAAFFGIDPEEFADLDPALLGEAGIDMPSESGGADPETLVRVLGRGDVAAVQTAFVDDFVFASERHAALCEALGLPGDAVNWGHRYLLQDSELEGRPAVVEL